MAKYGKFILAAENSIDAKKFMPDTYAPVYGDNYTISSIAFRPDNNEPNNSDLDESEFNKYQFYLPTMTGFTKEAYRYCKCEFSYVLNVINTAVANPTQENVYDAQCKVIFGTDCHDKATQQIIYTNRRTTNLDIANMIRSRKDPELLPTQKRTIIFYTKRIKYIEPHPINPPTGGGKKSKGGKKSRRKKKRTKNTLKHRI